MDSAVHRFFMAQMRQLGEGRVDAVASAYSAPLVVALPNVDPGFVVLSTRSQIEDFFRLEYEGLQRAGISEVKAAVRETAHTATDRIVATVEHLYLTDQRALSDKTTARYFMERQQDVFCVGMIEFERLAIPSIVTWFQQAGQPAIRPPSGPTH